MVPARERLIVAVTAGVSSRDVILIKSGGVGRGVKRKNPLPDGTDAAEGDFITRKLPANEGPKASHSLGRVDTADARMNGQGGHIP